MPIVSRFARFRLRFLALLTPFALLLSCQKTAPAETELPILATLQKFSLVDQDDKSFTQEELKGNVSIAAFMFTRCPTICPLMTQHMKKLQARAKKQGLDLHFVSFSVDPQHDTPEVLRKYIDDQKVDQENWRFLSGEYGEIKRTSVNGFKLALEGKADPKAANFGILHSSYLILIDQDLRLRGYYSTQEPGELDELLGDAMRLLHGS